MLTGSLGRLRAAAGFGSAPPGAGTSAGGWERNQMAAIIQCAVLCAPPAKPMTAGERREPA